MLRPLLRAPVAVCACWLLASLASCVRERTLFEAAAAGQSGDAGGAGTAGQSSGGSAESGGSGSAGSSGSAGIDGGGVGGVGSAEGGKPASVASGGEGGNGGRLVSPWTESSCVGSLSAGKTGDACLEVFKCAADVDCCSVLSYCDGKTLSIENVCNLCPVKCSADSDCGAKALCENYGCKSCPTNPCPSTWSTVLRNGCTVCVPPNQCKIANDPVCGSLICAPGLSCLPGCKPDPSCCFGNRCVDPSCVTLKGLDCLVAGCPAGSFCKEEGPENQCKCDPSSGTFSCVGSGQSMCNAY